MRWFEYNLKFPVSIWLSKTTKRSHEICIGNACRCTHSGELHCNWKFIDSHMHVIKLIGSQHFEFSSTQKYHANFNNSFALRWFSRHTILTTSICFLQSYRGTHCYLRNRRPYLSLFASMLFVCISMCCCSIILHQLGKKWFSLVFTPF